MWVTDEGMFEEAFLLLVGHRDRHFTWPWKFCRAHTEGYKSLWCAQKGSEKMNV